MGDERKSPVISSHRGNVHSSQAGWNDKLYIITAVVSLYLPGGRHRFRPLSCYLLADSVHKIDCPEMLYLSVCAGNRTKYRRDQGNHNIIDTVLPHRTEREVHALSKSSLIHLPFAVGDSCSVEPLVQKQVEGDVDETQCPQNVAPPEDPGQTVRIRAIGDPVVESGGQDEDGHLDGKEMRFEETVSQVHEPFPIGALQSIGHHIGIDTVLDSLLRV